MSELLIELFSEEIPARMQARAEEAYKEIFAKYLQNKELSFDGIRVFSGSRRITILVTGMASLTEEKFTSIKGPRTDSPKAAVDGFCRSNNIAFNKLSIKEVKGQDCYFFEQNLPTRRVSEVLQESLAEPIMEYIWPKSMYWSDHKIKWVRPLKNIVCLFNEEIIPFNLGHLTANNITYGHRFASAQAEIKVKNFQEYRQALAENYVILDRQERIGIIREQIAKTLLESKFRDLQMKEDHDLLEEVAGLVEYPVVLEGNIDPKFTELPKEIIITSMRTHQKYFSVMIKPVSNPIEAISPHSGRFLFVSNNPLAENDEKIRANIIAGNQKVLSARLSDALYFYEQDLKKPLDRSAELVRVIFHAKLGTLKDKVGRVQKIINHLFNNRPILEESFEITTTAATYYKSDIVSEVVGEFPELQGVMGYYYARANNLGEKVATAIRDHYKPVGASDTLPNEEAAILALADKIDSLCGLMLAGEKATGSKDPYGLRRTALGIIRIILESQASLDLAKIEITDLVNSSCSLFDSSLSNETIKQEIISFVEERAKNYFIKEKNYDQKIVEAVTNFGKESSLQIIDGHILVLRRFLLEENGIILLGIYKRVSNILAGKHITGSIKEALFNEYDRKLAEDIDRVSKTINASKFLQSLLDLCQLQTPINSFFDNNLVVDSNPEIANNRLLLLSHVKELFAQLADFDKL